MNVFKNPDTANNYDAYYQTELGKKVDEIEKRIISNLIKDMPRYPMLELGCGTGHWSAFFIEEGFKLTGIDISKAMLRLAKQKDINADFYIANAQKLPFNSDSFQIVSSITMLEFVEDRDKVLLEIYRILKPGGWVILGCLNANSILAGRKEQDETFKYAHFLTPEEITEGLKIFGIPVLDSGVYLTQDFELLDDTNDAGNVEPAFIAAIVQKNK